MTASRRDSASYRAVPSGTLLAARLHLYASYGWALLPLLPVGYPARAGDSPGKSPHRDLLRDIYGDTSTSHLKAAPAFPEEVEYWFENDPDCNLGVFPSAVYGLVLVDIDDLDLLNPSLVTPTASSGRDGGGRHLYLSSRDEIPRQAFSWGHLNPEYLVLPGSLHFTGRRYEWLPGLSPEEVPLMTLDAALEALELVEERS